MSIAAVGVDLGGTKVAAAPLCDGQLGESVVRATSLADSSDLLEELVAVVREAAGERLDAVGVGVPSIVEFETGRVISSVNVPLADIPLRQVLGERLGVPVFVDNDATVAALAEAHDEELRPVVRNLVMLTVGTGIGGGLVLDGRIYRGSTGGAGELGHTIVGLDFRGPVPEPAGFPQPGVQSDGPKARLESSPRVLFKPTVRRSDTSQITGFVERLMKSEKFELTAAGRLHE